MKNVFLRIDCVCHKTCLFRANSESGPNKNYIRLLVHKICTICAVQNDDTAADNYKY